MISFHSAHTISPFQLALYIIRARIKLKPYVKRTYDGEEVFILDQQCHSPPAKLLDDSIVSKGKCLLGGEQLEIVRKSHSVS